MRIVHFLTLALLLAIFSCSVEETVTLPESEENDNSGQAQVVKIQTLTIQVLDEQGQPVAGAIVGSIPTLNSVQTLSQTPTDGKERQLATERFITDENGTYTFDNMTFNLLQSPLFFNAYDKDDTDKTVYFGSTFVDLEADQEQVSVTIQLKGRMARNPSVKVALFDPEPFPRAIDFLSREGLYFDNLIYDQYYQSGAHDWQNWTESTWDQVFDDSNLAQYDVILIGFDASKYAEFDLLVKYKQALIDFVKEHDNKLLFLAQQNHTSFTWSWLADFDVPQEGLNGGFLTTLYETAHLEDARLTEAGKAHPLFVDTLLASEEDMDGNGIADVWENWSHIEPNKPQVKEKVAWHAGNRVVFEESGWRVLVSGPASKDYFDLPQGSGVITAIKRFDNGSRIFFSDATYYQASYGPRKAAPALILKDRYVDYIADWPALRQD